eukprot:gene670-407_t
MALDKSASVPILTALSNHRKGQKWTMNGRWKEGSRRNPNPSPGSYQTINPCSYKYANSSAFGFGTGSRNVFTKDNAPSPAKYDTRDMAKTMISFSFGSAGRSTLARVSMTPGPGQYKLKNLVGNEGAPLYSCAKRCWRDDIKKKTAPGPGAYKPNGGIMSPRTPEWTMGSGQRSSSAGGIRHVPGPGAYDSVATVGVNNSTFKNTPNWSMTSRTYLPVPKNSSDYMMPPMQSFG